MNLVQTIGVCGNVLAGAAQILPVEIANKITITNYKIKNYILDYSGVTFGVLAYQSIVLTGNSTLLAHKWVITGVASGLGALALKLAMNQPGPKPGHPSDWVKALLQCQYVANGVLGLVSLYQRQYAFGLSALACTVHVYL